MNRNLPLAALGLLAVLGGPAAAHVTLDRAELPDLQQVGSDDRLAAGGAGGERDGELEEDGKAGQGDPHGTGPGPEERRSHGHLK